MNERILLVEDDAYLRDGLCELFSKEGYEAASAKNLAEGKKLFESGAFDLVVLDVMLPDGSGLELCSYIREGGFSVPVLFLTACDE